MAIDFNQIYPNNGGTTVPYIFFYFYFLLLHGLFFGNYTW